MKNAFLYLFTLLLYSTLIQAQDKPGIDKITFSMFSKTKSKELLPILTDANKLYNKKIYDKAFKLYLKLYDEVDSINALNYRLGVSALMENNSYAAIFYLLKSHSSISRDYYLRLGEAYQLNHQYKNAGEAFHNYNQSLNKCKQRKFSARLKQLQRECQFGAKTVKDSLPYFVTNLGKSVNGYYDEYSPVILHDTNILYYTSRQPPKVNNKPVCRSTTKENIKYATFDVAGTTVSQPLQGIKQRKNTSVAGADHAHNQLFYYKGGERSGSLYALKVDHGKGVRSSIIKGAVNRKTVHETYLCTTARGDAAFVSDKNRYSGGYDIYFSPKTTKRRIKKSRPAGNAINTTFDEKSITFSPDGNTLYFSSNGHLGMGGFDIYKAQRQADGAWSEPINLGYPINTAADELYYYPTGDSLVALMASDRAGGEGGLDLYQVVKDIRIPFDLWGNIIDIENGGVVSGKITVFNAETKQPILSVSNDSLSGKYTAHLEDVGNYWIQAEAKGYLNQVDSIDMPVNRKQQVRKDFHLQRLASPFTVFGTVKNKHNGAPLQAEILLVQSEKDSIVARAYTNSADGSYSVTLDDKLNMTMQVNAINYYGCTDTLMLRDNKTDTFKKDIYLERSKISYTVSGVVRDAKDNSVIPASLSFYQPGEQIAMMVAHTDSISGKYFATLQDKGPFVVEVNAEGYFFTNMALAFPADSTLLIRNVSLQKMSTGSKIVVENILFNTGKATLLPQSFIELNKLARLLDENSDIRIEVSGHSDNMGSAGLNKRLSRNRAESVWNYLRERGIDEARMLFKGYGFDKPIVSNDTAEGRAANRRVEIKVIE
ncbi:WD40-like Beta Propeller Repeat [Saccharicrinis carchari]|uniref:WD40-like Beta Propeller Repeat n=1 Tax=Saccharicrinis carchari TaxID=1168039 RepID=A0A521D3W6_SACCC|nr:OmpA family protein [Saccharicrinis carchari]SMO66388.1 WD40-like Beta Propeller Repeat [Saccharicrinis carchari]